MTGVWALAAPRECGDVSDELKRAQHSHLSSPGLTGRPSIPEALMMESRGCGVLDRPVKRGDDSFFWLRATRTMSLLARLDPFRGASPQRVAMFGTEKTEMADLGRSHIGRRDGEDFRLDRDKACAKQFDRRTRRPGIIGKAQRAHRAIELRKVLQAAEPGVVEQIA